MAGKIVCMAVVVCGNVSAFFVHPHQGLQARFSLLRIITKHNNLSPYTVNRRVEEFDTSFRNRKSVFSYSQKMDDFVLADKSKATPVSVAFSHIHLFVDNVESLDVYKRFEEQLNKFDVAEKAAHLTLDERRELWSSFLEKHEIVNPFVPQNRDVVKQLMTGFGFRVTGYRFPCLENTANTKSVLITSRDPGGVQLVVTALSDDTIYEKQTDEFIHFDAGEYLTYHSTIH